MIQFLSLIYYKYLKNKKLFSVYDDNIFPFFRVFHRELPDYFKFWTVTKNVTHDETHQQSSCKVDLGDGVTLPVKFACKPEL